MLKQYQQHATAAFLTGLWILACLIAYSSDRITLTEALGFSVVIAYCASIILEYVYDSTMWIGGVASPSLRQDDSRKNAIERLTGLALGCLGYIGAIVVMLFGL